MPDQVSRNIKDADLIITRALPTADATVVSTDFDLGAVSPGVTAEGFELLLAIPALSATLLPNADTLTITVRSGSTATPTTSLGIVRVITGTGSTIAAQEFRVKLPSNVGRYVNVQYVAAGGTGDMSGVSATQSLCF
jgi:hypothetical protein